MPFACYVADKPFDGEGIGATTLRSYERRLEKFRLWLGVEHRVLRRVQIETAERFVRTAKNLKTRRNLAITLRSFATYLARKKLWYVGDENVRLSAHDLAMHQPGLSGGVVVGVKQGNAARGNSSHLGFVHIGNLPGARSDELAYRLSRADRAAILRQQPS
jgi:hypothetical protein